MPGPSLASQAFGYAGVAAAFMLFVSPAPTCRRIRRAGDTLAFSALPCLAQSVESSWWMLWAWAAGNRVEMLVNNAVGVSINLVYVACFLRYANAERKRSIYTQAGVAAVLVLIAGVLAATLEEPDMVFGTTAMTLTALKYAAPLSVMRLVVATRSVEFMPLPLTLAALACSFFWLGHGLLLEDWFITAPNLCGMVLATLQLAIYARYRRKGGEEESASGTSLVEKAAAAAREALQADAGAQA